MSSVWNIPPRHSDWLFGVIGTGGSVGLMWVNAVLAAIAATLTISVMALRLRREWQHRDRPPE